MALSAPNVSALPRLGPAVGVVALVALLLVHRRRAARAAAVTAMPRFYARALRALARRGLTPAPGETAREFARRAAASAGPPLAPLTGAYERVRFGGAALTTADAAEVEAWLSALEKARS
jgi:hypothetical protein